MSALKRWCVWNQFTYDGHSPKVIAIFELARSWTRRWILMKESHVLGVVFGDLAKLSRMFKECPKHLLACGDLLCGDFTLKDHMLTDSVCHRGLPFVRGLLSRRHSTTNSEI